MGTAKISGGGGGTKGAEWNPSDEDGHAGCHTEHGFCCKLYDKKYDSQHPEHLREKRTEQLPRYDSGEVVQDRR